MYTYFTGQMSSQSDIASECIGCVGVRAMCLFQLILKVHISRIFSPFSNLDSNAIQNLTHARTRTHAPSQYAAKSILRENNEPNEPDERSECRRIKSCNGLSNWNIETVRFFQRVHYCAGVWCYLFANANAQHIMCDIHSNANIYIDNEIQSDSFVFLFTRCCFLFLFLARSPSPRLFRMCGWVKPNHIVSAFAEKLGS